MSKRKPYVVNRGSKWSGPKVHDKDCRHVKFHYFPGITAAEIPPDTPPARCCLDEQYNSLQTGNLIHGS